MFMKNPPDMCKCVLFQTITIIVRPSVCQFFPRLNITLKHCITVSPLYVPNTIFFFSRSV